MWARRAGLAILPLVLLAAAAWTLHVELRGFHLRDVERELALLPAGALLLAAGVTALDYLLLSGYDLLALRYAGRRLPLPRVIFTSFVSYAFGNNVGLALLSSGSVRFRLYSQWGLSAVEITRVVAFTASQLWAGLLPIAGVALLAGVPVPLPGWAARGLGVAALGAVAGYLAIAARGGRSIGLRGFSFPVPSLPLAAAQCAVSAADWTLAALVLHALLPAGSPLSFPQLLGLFVAAQVAGLASQVPGGLGVFDSIVLAALTPAVPAPAVLSSLVAYRLVYYLGPFLLAFGMLVAHEVVVHRARVGRLLRGAHASFAPVVPWLAAGGALVAGAVLLVSGATPGVAGRLHLLRRTLPLPVLEASHLVGSLAGTALLLLARALARRIDAAWAITAVLLGAGAVTSLAKGLDWEEALLLLGLLGALLPFHRQFYRKSSLLEGWVSGPWVLAVAVIVGASLWIGLFSYRHVEYSSDLWFSFAFHADAPRFLRASVAGLSLLALFGIAVLLRPAPHEPDPPGEAELARVRPLVDRAPDSYAHLALVGDKPLLFSTGRRLPDVRRRGPHLGGHGRPGRPGPGGHRAGVAVPRALRPARRLGLLLPGRPGRAAALPRPRAHPAQARRGGAGAARGVLARGERLPRPAAGVPPRRARRARFEVAPPRGSAGADPGAEARLRGVARREARAGEGLLARARSTRATSPRVRSRSSGGRARWSRSPTCGPAPPGWSSRST